MLSRIHCSQDYTIEQPSTPLPEYLHYGLGGFRAPRAGLTTNSSGVGGGVAVHRREGAGVERQRAGGEVLRVILIPMDIAPHRVKDANLLKSELR